MAGEQRIPNGLKLGNVAENNDATEMLVIDGDGIVGKQVVPSGGGENPNYSTTEQLMGGTWINGKPIYKKTYFGSHGASLTYLVLDPEFNINFEKIIDFKGVLEINSNRYQLNSSFFSESSILDSGSGVGAFNGTQSRITDGFEAIIGVWALENDPDISGNVIKTYKAFDYHFTIEYTKTTDPIPE